MERRIILASHGSFASGILSSLELICGKQTNIEALDCYTEESFDLASEVSEIINNNQEKEIIVVTDIFGGSVNNEFLQYIHNSHFFLVAGMNLPFLVELVTQIEFVYSLEDCINEALSNSKVSIQFCNNILKNELQGKEEEF